MNLRPRRVHQARPLQLKYEGVIRILIWLMIHPLSPFELYPVNLTQKLPAVKEGLNLLSFNDLFNKTFKLNEMLIQIPKIYMKP